MSQGITLLLEFALPGGRIAISDGKDLLDNRVVEDTPTGTDEVLTILDEMLVSNSLSKNEICDIVCTRGPGGYTGIRVALSIVRGLKRALNIDAYAYPVFDVLLYGSKAHKTAAAIEAGRNEMLCAIAGHNPETTFFVSQSELGPELRKRGIAKLIVASDPSGAIKSSVGDQIAVISASDNVIKMLFDFHKSCDGIGKDALEPIYGREFIKKT